MRASRYGLIVALLLGACSSNGGSGATNGGLQVACPTGQTVCGNACVILSSDPLNCGGCGTTCAAGQACVAGSCSTTCPTGNLLCTNICVEARSDDLNCGSCGHACGTGTACVDGGCGQVMVIVPPQECGVGLTTCPVLDGGPDAGNDCVDIATDSLNCGGCGNVCPAGEACHDDQCQVSCLATELACGGQCVNPNTDSHNCGGCAGDGGVVCPAGEVCNGFGQCLSTCANPLAFCSGLRPTFDGGPQVDGGNPDAGYCADLSSDPRNCGTCDNACLSGSICLDGQCQIICPSAGQSCVTPQLLNDGGTFTGNSCCGSELAFSDGGCIASPSTPMVAFQLPQGSLLGSYTFQISNGFVGTYAPAICFSQADLINLTCTNDGSTSFPSSGETDYLAVGQADGGCGTFTLSVIVSNGL